MKHALPWVALFALAACDRAQSPQTPPAQTPPAQTPPTEAAALPANRNSNGPRVRVVLRGAVATAFVADGAAPPAGAADGRVLAPGDHVIIAAGDTQYLDVGLAARVSVTGPAHAATDPDGERRVFVLGGRVHVGVSPDAAARPFALELATPCGLVRVPRAAELDVSLAETGQCSFALRAGSADVLLADNAAMRRPLAADATLICAAGSACISRPGVEPAASRTLAVDAPAWQKYRAYLGEQLAAAAAEAGRLRAAEQKALKGVRAKDRSNEALALQRSLALGAADGRRARERVLVLRAAYRATGLAEFPTFEADPRESVVAAALGTEP